MCQLRYLDETPKCFEVKTGLRQRDALHPVRFSLVLKYQVVREIKKKTVHGTISLSWENLRTR